MKAVSRLASCREIFNKKMNCVLAEHFSRQIIFHSVTELDRILLLNFLTFLFNPIRKAG